MQLLQDNGNTFTGEYDNIAAYTVKKSDGTKVDVDVISDNKISFPTVAGETYTIDFNASPDKLQGVIDAAKEISAQMTDELLAEQKAHLRWNSSRQLKKQSQKKNLTNMMNQSQILSKAIQGCKSCNRH